jgi:hypothetical protein
VCSPDGWARTRIVRYASSKRGPDYGHYDEGRWPADILDARWLALAERSADWI